MKFWQLESICRWHGGPLLVNTLQEYERDDLIDVLRNYDYLVSTRQRHILDQVVPEKIVISVLSKLDVSFEVVEGTLRLAKDGGAHAITALRAAELYGAELIEEVYEKGGAKIDT